MSQPAQNDNLVLNKSNRKQSEAQNITNDQPNSKSRKSSQSAAKDTSQQIKAANKQNGGNTNKKAKKNSSIEPPMIINQQPQHQSSAVINSQMVSLNLKKRALAPSKRVALNRIKSTHAADEVDYLVQPGSAVDVIQQRSKKVTDTSKPIGSLFQSQKDQQEKCPQIQANDIVFKCNLSTNVNERGSSSKKNAIPISQELLKSPQHDTSNTELRDRRRSQGVGNKAQASQITNNSGKKSNSTANTNTGQPIKQQILQQKPTALRIKNVKKNADTLKDEVAIEKQQQPLTPSGPANSKNMRQAYPLNLNKIDLPTTQLMDGQKNKDFLSSLDLQTPTGAKDERIVTTNNDEEEQLEIDDDSQSKSKSPAGHSSGSSSGDQIGSDDSDEDDELNKADAEKKAEEAATHEEMRNFAEQNGFKLEYENKKKKIDENDFMVLYEKAKNFKITKEILDEQQKEDEKKFLQRMQKLVPPPLELLKKKYTNREPIRTGFNEGLLPIQVKNNFEVKRYQQGPQIVITTMSQSFMDRQKRLREQSFGSRERSSRKSFRSMSRERGDFDSRPMQRGNSNFRHPDLMSSRDSTMKPQTASNDPDEEKVQVKEVYQANPYNSEVSLRHLFYLEYKQKFPEGQTNPIVYSRFGKQNYNSDEKFNSDNFNQLIRTCNIKKILRLQDCQNLLFKKERSKFSEPVSFPSGDYYVPTGEKDKTLVFESRFESGNLQLAHKVSDHEYDLILQNDINSKGHTQWFYFRVSNVKKGLKVKFNMLNMIKPKSLYNDGMKVLIYSEKKQQQAAETEGGIESEGGWHRGGDDIGYYQNNYKKEHQINFQRYYYTFTFTHTFEFDEDQVYFAYSIPYTYTDLTNYLCEIESKQLNYVTRNTLCRTIAGNKCEYLTITNRVPFDVDKKKEGVVFTGRIHPGESNSSLMMKGIIDFLISNDPKAHELREKFVFKIVPMLNPDGVINGNYRCSLAGCDLNRRWKYPSEILHPTIYHTKKLISRLATERPMALYCDLHGHSRRKNVFMYGNNHDDNPKAPRIFPFLLSKLAQPHFSYDYSKFSYCRTKEQTGRIAMWRELGSKNPNIFTLEASFCGPKSVKYEPHRGNKRAPAQSEVNYHFITKDYSDIGNSVCETLLIYRNEKESKMGLSNTEYMIEQYHLDKEAKIEQEDLIRQQQVMVDERKAQEMNKRTRENFGPYGAFNEDKPAEPAGADGPAQQNTANKKDTALVTSEKKEVNKSTRKMVKKAKTESVAQAIDEANKLDIFGSEKKPVKKKAKYNLRDAADSSDAQSDSEPSEDNLEEDQIGKLIPKKWNKKRYLKGIDEKKKKPKPETPKKVEKKPKTMLMPCMSHKKNNDAEKEKKRENSESVVKKIRLIQNSISKTIASRFRNGQYVRDTATQVKYKGDGKNLSLMELDILCTTGAKWSRILWPGYKGPRMPENEKIMELKTEDRESCSNFMNDANISNLRTPVSKFNTEMSQFSNSQNEQLRQDPASKKKIKSFGILNQNRSIMTNELIKQSMDIDQQQSTKQTTFKEGTFMNERRSSQGRTPISISENSESNQIDKLKKKIIEGNFSEPKSLFKGMDPCSNNNQMKSKLRQYAFDYGQKKILSDSKTLSKIDQSSNNIYDLSLETVQEKVNDKSCLTLDVSELMKGRDRNLAQYNHNFNTKKIVNGEVIQQQQRSSSNNSYDPNSNANILNTKTHVIHKLESVISEGLRVRNNIGYGSQNLHSSNSSKNHNSISSQSRQQRMAQESQQQLQGKLSFSNVAQQILCNNSSCDKQKKSTNGAVYDDNVHQSACLPQLQMTSKQATSLVGRSINVNFANYKSVQQNGKQRRGSMLKEQMFASNDLSADQFLNGSTLSIKGVGTNESQQILGIGTHLVAPSQSGGGSISQLSAGISIKNYNQEDPRQNFFQNQSNVSDIDLIHSSTRNKRLNQSINQ